MIKAQLLIVSVLLLASCTTTRTPELIPHGAHGLIPQDVNQILGQMGPHMPVAKVRKIVKNHYPDAKETIGDWSGQTGYVGFTLTPRYSLSFAAYKNPKDPTRFVHADMNLSVYDLKLKRGINISFHNTENAKTKDGTHASKVHPGNALIGVTLEADAQRIRRGEAIALKFTIVNASKKDLLYVYYDDNAGYSNSARLSVIRNGRSYLDGVPSAFRTFKENLRITRENIAMLPAGQRHTYRYPSNFQSLPKGNYEFRITLNSPAAGDMKAIKGSTWWEGKVVSQPVFVTVE